jgi:hypothetical protein
MMRETLRYAAASLALGLIAYFASEAFFWSFRPDGATLPDIAMTVVAYSIAGACVLTAVAMSGCGGVRAAFLGGAVLGFLVEGVVVGTMYEAFPFQIVWTPIAWHALVSGAAVFALHRTAVHWAAWRQVAAMLALGAFGGFFAAFWPMERAVLPGTVDTVGYLMGSGAAAVLGFVILDRVGQVPVPGRIVRWIAPVLAVILFAVQTAFAPSPLRLACPLVIGLTVWAMARHGSWGMRVSFGMEAPLWRHALFLIASGVTAAIAAGLVAGTAGMEANIPVALATAVTGLSWWLWLLFRAAYPRRAASA